MSYINGTHIETHPKSNIGYDSEYGPLTVQEREFGILENITKFYAYGFLLPSSKLIGRCFTTPLHKSTIVCQYFTQKSTVTLGNPPYSPDLHLIDPY